MPRATKSKTVPLNTNVRLDAEDAERVRAFARLTDRHQGQALRELIRRGLAVVEAEQVGRMRALGLHPDRPEAG